MRGARILTAVPMSDDRRYADAHWRLWPTRRLCGFLRATSGHTMDGVADGTRTHDNRNHNRKRGVVAFRKRL